MTTKERFLKTMRFEAVDYPPFYPGHPWDATRKRWENEGLSQQADLGEALGIEELNLYPTKVDTLLCPPFDEIILEQNEEYIIKINQHGVKERNFKDGRSMPEFLEYPIKGPESLSWLAERLNPDMPGRIPPDWLDDAQKRRQKGSVILCNGGMYFAFLNEHMGTDHLMLAYYDCPKFIHEVNELLCRNCEKALKTIMPEFQLDCLGFHEDMAYRNGPLIAPEMFQEFMTPYYQRVMSIASQNGIDLAVMDSDGDIRKLIPLWLENGINIFSPMEVAAGMDVVGIRQEYGKSVRMIGGFDKRILASTKQQIKNEVERIRPVIEGGGFIPGCDHAVPPDVSWENFQYFVECLKVAYGIR